MHQGAGYQHSEAAASSSSPHMLSLLPRDVIGRKEPELAPELQQLARRRGPKSGVTY